MATAASRLFSWSSSNRRTIVLGLAAAGAVTAAVIVSLPHHESPQRRAVSKYIVGVDGVEAGMTYPMSRVLTAYRAYATGALTPKVATQLAQAEQTLSLLGRRISALPAPPQAAHLRVLLLRLVSAEAEITGEVKTLASFAPRYRASLTAVQQASVRLSKQLSSIKSPAPRAVHGTAKQVKLAQAAFVAASARAAAEQATVLRTYDAALGRTVARLRRLVPPPVFRPAFKNQLTAYEDTIVAGNRLAAELDQPVRTNVATLERAFTVASRRAQTLAAQREEIAAVKAYDARARAVRSAQTDVLREVARLSNTVH
jgi:hypothetical protein